MKRRNPSAIHLMQYLENLDFNWDNQMDKFGKKLKKHTAIERIVGASN